MSELIGDLGDLWDIVLDILGYYHRCCINCQPWESGEPVWLSEQYCLGEEIENTVDIVCETNDHELSSDLDISTIEAALREKPFECPNCGTSHNEYIANIGGYWLTLRGEETSTATYLLTRTYWPYLTHYTKTDRDYNNGLDRLLAIINSGIIRGSLNGLSGNHPAACFTECSPIEINEMLEMMESDIVTLPGRNRGFEWRRSKHGIAIRREALVSYGARPVIHGDSSLHDRLDEDELWKFKEFKINSDWTFEREFRVPHSVDLSRISPEDIIIIVKDTGEQFKLLAKRDIPIYAIIPFDYVYSKEDPRPRLSNRQKEKMNSADFWNTL